MAKVEFRKIYFIIIIIFINCFSIAFTEEIKLNINVDERQINVGSSNIYIDVNSSSLYLDVSSIQDMLDVQITEIGNNQLKIVQKFNDFTIVVNYQLEKQNTSIDYMNVLIINNKPFLPIRYVSECINARVNWDNDKKQVNIYTQKFKKSESGFNDIRYINNSGVKGIKSLEDVVNINDKVHNLLRYGEGILGSETARDLLAYGEGHCGDYSYLLYRELLKKEYFSRTVDITSTYHGSIHSLVEVRIGDKWYTFDPTYNLYYPNNVQELVENPELVDEKVCKVKVNSYYTHKEFFANPTNINYIYNYDFRDNNVASLNTGVKVESKTEFIEPFYGIEIALNDNSPFEGYAAGLNYVLPQHFTLDFGSTKEIYRGKIIWFNEEELPKKFRIEYYDEYSKEYELLLREDKYNNSKRNNIYEFVLSKPIETQKVRFVLEDTYSQKRILIRKIMLFK